MLLFLLFICATRTDTWAVIVSTSITWQKYRHTVNALSVYQTVRRLGVPKSRIILMLADDITNNERNPYKGSVYEDSSCKIDLAEDVSVDYRNDEVTPELFYSAVLGLGTAVKKRLGTDSQSRIILYITGHGVDGYMNFREKDEISQKNISDIFRMLYLLNAYKEILFIVDTCQASSLFKSIKEPNIIGIASSSTTEPSYSHHNNRKCRCCCD